MVAGRSIRTVLVVDDDAVILRSWQRALQADGKTVLVARDRETALSCLDPIPDVAIVDLNLDELGAGIEVIRELKRLVPTIRRVST